MNEDLTVLMLTANRVPEAWFGTYREMLLEAVGDAAIITFSYRPLDWGVPNVIQREHSSENIFRMVLRGCEAADTPYIAIADDDTLYPAEHYRFRPPADRFGYNLHRWHMLTWADPPYYFLHQVPGNGLMIAPRDLAFRAIRHRVEAGLPRHLLSELGTRVRHTRGGELGVWMGFWSVDPVVSFCHPGSVDRANRFQRKRPGPVWAYDIPRWGRAEEVRALWR